MICLVSFVLELGTSLKMAGFAEGFLLFTDIHQIFGNQGINRCFIKTSVCGKKKKK